MSQPDRPDPIDRLAAWTLAGVCFLVPLVYCSGLADPFSFPKRTVILAGAIVLGAIATLRRRSQEAAAVSAPVMPLAIVFLVCAAIACVRAVNVGLALWGLLDLAAGVLLLVGTIRCLRDATAVRLVLRSYLVAAAIGALGSLLQIFLPGQQASWLAYLLPPNRGGSTLGDPALTPQCLILALPIGVGAAALSSGAWRLICGGLLGVVAATLVFIGRPEGWIGGVAALALIIVGRIAQAAGRGRRWSDLAPDLAGEGLRVFLIAGIVFLLIIALSRFGALYPGGKPVTPLAGVSLLSPTTGDAMADRAAAIPGTISLIRRHPVGVGPGCWRHAFLEVAWQGPGETPFTLSHQAVHPGNAFLELAAETGIPGGITLALLVLLVLAQSLAAAARAAQPWDSAASAAFGAAGVVVVMSFFGAPLQEPTPSLLFWLAAGMAHNTRFVGWGCGFFDFDNDGWKDLLLVNGHVFPEVERLKIDIHYKDRAILYHNNGKGSFTDVSERAGAGILERHAARGAAFADYDNDGSVEVLINNQNEAPSLLKSTRKPESNWVILKLEGAASNRSAIGARVHLTAGGRTQIDEVRSGGSYLSQNDLRLHFGLGGAAKIDRLEIAWPSGTRQTERELEVNRVIRIREPVQTSSQ